MDKKWICLISLNEEIKHIISKNYEQYGFSLVSVSTLLEAADYLDQIQFLGVIIDPDVWLEEHANLLQWAYNKVGSFGYVVIIKKPFVESDIIEYLKKCQKYNSLTQDLRDTLFEEYQQNVPKKISEIQLLLDKLKEQVEERTLITLRLYVHKLAGNAGLFGYDQVSNECRIFEQEINSNLEKQIKDINIELYEKYLANICHGFSYGEKNA